MQMLANGVELLYRRRGAGLYKMRDYSRSGPSIDYKGTGLGRLLEVVRAHKDATNEEYRKTATLNLRMFVEQFVKELYEVDTGKQLAKKLQEDKSWGELKALLKFCTRLRHKRRGEAAGYERLHEHPPAHRPKSRADRRQQRAPQCALYGNECAPEKVPRSCWASSARTENLNYLPRAEVLKCAFRAWITFRVVAKGLVTSWPSAVLRR